MATLSYLERTQHVLSHQCHWVSITTLKGQNTHETNISERSELSVSMVLTEKLNNKIEYIITKCQCFIQTNTLLSCLKSNYCS